MPQSPKTAHAGGDLRTSAQPSPYVPSHYLRRVARSILMRAAVKGRISWIVALQMLALVEGGAQ